MKKLLSATFALFLSSCATYPPPVDSHASYRLDEGSSLRGMSGMRWGDETFSPCADVWMFPNTPYFERALSDNALLALSPETKSLVHRASCDGSGDFVFAHLPAQQWILAAYVPTSSHEGYVVTRLVSTRVGIQDEVFLYTSDSDVRELGSIVAPPSHKVQVRRIQRKEFLPWGYQGEK